MLNNICRAVLCYFPWGRERNGRVAMAQSQLNLTKSIPSFVLPTLQLQACKGTFTTNTDTTGNGNINDNSNSGGIDMNGDVRGFCNQGRSREVSRILHVMDEQPIEPDSSTYSSLLQKCTNDKALREGKLIHAHMIDRGFNADIFLWNNLVIMYVNCGCLVDARRVLEEMPKQNVVSWTAMITAYAKRGNDEEALTLYYRMRREGIRPNKFTFSGVLPACANLASLKHGREVHGDITRSALQSNIFVGSALVDMYAKCGTWQDARQVFDEMPERNMVSWNAMIAGYAQHGVVDEALQLFQKIPERDAVSWTAMIAGYAQNGYVEEALKLFQKVPERDLFSWSAMIAAYAQNDRCNESWKLFRQMHLTGLKPDSVAFTSILPACANLAALINGKGVHENIIRSGFQSHISVANSLVDMYAKCGTIEDARQVFDEMPVRDIVSWNVIIVGCAKHGYGKEALQLFEQMQYSGMEPNHVTFIGVLSSCSHAGLVDDGWRYFDRMSRDYHVTPAVEHYSCMVDLLGRAGRLDEAYNFIHKMPMKPSVSLWSSLLAACTIHINVELAEHAAECLFELDPKNAAFYVLLSNVYAAACRWNDVEKVRKLMKDRRVKKMPGCSWIEVNNKVYSFLVRDRSHPQTHKIYAELERLSWQMKEAGYIPETNSVLHDADEEQKEHILSHCSEKPPTAFGLIHTFPGLCLVMEMW